MSKKLDDESKTPIWHKTKKGLINNVFESVSDEIKNLLPKKEQDVAVNTELAETISRIAGITANLPQFTGIKKETQIKKVKNSEAKIQGALFRNFKDNMERLEKVPGTSYNFQTIIEKFSDQYKFLLQKKRTEGAINVWENSLPVAIEQNKISSIIKLLSMNLFTSNPSLKDTPQAELLRNFIKEIGKVEGEDNDQKPDDQKPDDQKREKSDAKFTLKRKGSFTQDLFINEEEIFGFLDKKLEKIDGEPDKENTFYEKDDYVFLKRGELHAIMTVICTVLDKSNREVAEALSYKYSTLMCKIYKSLGSLEKLVNIPKSFWEGVLKDLQEAKKRAFSEEKKTNKPSIKKEKVAKHDDNSRNKPRLELAITEEEVFAFSDKTLEEKEGNVILTPKELYAIVITIDDILDIHIRDVADKINCNHNLLIGKMYHKNDKISFSKKFWEELIVLLKQAKDLKTKSPQLKIEKGSNKNVVSNSNDQKGIDGSDSVGKEAGKGEISLNSELKTDGPESQSSEVGLNETSQKEGETEESEGLPLKTFSMEVKKQGLNYIDTLLKEKQILPETLYKKMGNISVFTFNSIIRKTPGEDFLKRLYFAIKGLEQK